jgi:hypothetical protein
MSLLGRLRSIAEVRDPTSPVLAAGTQEEQRRARLEWRRERDARGIRERWEEIPSDRLVFSRYWIEDTETGNLYREFGGDPGYAESVVAFYERDGWPVMLQPADPPSLDELERRQAAKAERRRDRAAAAKARYDELRKVARR